MKKNLWIWALAALSMTACTSEDAPTPEQIVTENDWISPDGRVVVQLSADALPEPTISVGSRAIGPVNGTNIEALDSLGIFALARNDANYTEDSETNETILLDNVLAAGKSTVTLDPELHTGTDGASLKRVSLYSSKDNKKDGKPGVYYYPVSAKYNYDFFGYHPYQESENIERTANDVTVTFDMSQGNIDLITGIAEKADDVSDNKLYVEEKDGTAIIGDTENVWEGYNARYIRKIKYSNELVDNYSSQAETDQITKKPYIPNIKFEHQTTQLRFFVVANDKQSTSDKENTERLRVEDIKLLNIPMEAQWSVKQNKINWTANGDEMEMQKIGCDAWVGYTSDPSNIEECSLIKPTANAENAQQVGYLMVAPQATYELSLRIYAPEPVNNEEEGDGVPQYQDTKVTIKMVNEQSFEPKKYYNIYIQLNAFQEVNVNAELVDWVEGDDVYIPVGEDE